jgi:hypothetical protein
LEGTTTNLEMKVEGNENKIIKLSEDVLIKYIGKEMILVYPKNALILSINELGAEIIDNIRKGDQTSNTLAQAIQSSYEVELDTVKLDISEFMSKLIESKVIEFT